MSRIEAVRERSGGGLVEDALDVEPSDGSGVFRRLALGVVEIGGDGDDRLGDGLTEECLGDLLQHAEDDPGHLRGRHLALVDRDPGVAVVVPRDAI